MGREFRKSLKNYKGYNLIGRRFGKLLVTRFVKFVLRRRYGHEMVLEAECDCGATIQLEASRFRGAKSCGCLWSRNILEPGESGFRSTISHMKRNARNRGYEWSLSEEFTRIILKKSCFYCGIKAGQITNRTRQKEPYIYNGLDRVDNC